MQHRRIFEALRQRDVNGAMSAMTVNVVTALNLSLAVAGIAVATAKAATIPTHTLTTLRRNLSMQTSIGSKIGRKLTFCL